MPKPKLVKSKVVAKNTWARMLKEDLEFPSGNKGEYLVLEREMGLMIIVLEKIDNIIYTYLIKQYRYPIDKEVWQFPMGTNENGKDPKKHARQELKEETGLLVGELKKVGEYFVDPGISRQKCSVFITEEVISHGKQELEELEAGTTVTRVSLEEFNQMILDNKLNDAWGYAAKHFIDKYLKKPF